MVEQKSDDNSEGVDVVTQSPERARLKFTRALGQLLVAEDGEQARIAIFESMYQIAVSGYLETRSDLLEGVKSREEIQVDVEALRAVVGMLQAPAKDWQTFKFAIDSTGRTFYEELAEEGSEFNLKEDFGLPEDFGVMGIPVLQSSEFVDFERQKELFGELLLNKLKLVPNVKSLWEHPRAGDFKFDFELP